MHIILAALIIAAAIGGGGVAVAAPLSPLGTTVFVMAALAMVVNGLWYLVSGDGRVLVTMLMLILSLPLAMLLGSAP